MMSWRVRRYYTISNCRLKRCFKSPTPQLTKKRGRSIYGPALYSLAPLTAAGLLFLLQRHQQLQDEQEQVKYIQVNIDGQHHRVANGVRIMLDALDIKNQVEAEDNHAGVQIN